MVAFPTATPPTLKSIIALGMGAYPWAKVAVKVIVLLGNPEVFVMVKLVAAQLIF